MSYEILFLTNRIWKILMRAGFLLFKKLLQIWALSLFVKNKDAIYELWGSQQNKGLSSHKVNLMTV